MKNKDQIKNLEAKQKEILKKMEVIRNKPETPRFFAHLVKDLREEYHQVQNQICELLKE